MLDIFVRSLPPRRGGKFLPSVLTSSLHPIPNLAPPLWPQPPARHPAASHQPPPCLASPAPPPPPPFTAVSHAPLFCPPVLGALSRPHGVCVRHRLISTLTNHPYETGTRKTLSVPYVRVHVRSFPLLLLSLPPPCFPSSLPLPPIPLPCPASFAR